jgi:single-strand DNA-binding protein
MSNNSLTLTLTGWVGTEPKHFAGTGTPYTSFRMASTRRFYDTRQNEWVDGKTLWFTVKVWREAALNVAECLRKSDPVVVHGRLGTEEWDSPEGPRSALVIEALAIGPDLTYGQARFARTIHRSAGPGGEDDVVDAIDDPDRETSGVDVRSTDPDQMMPSEPEPTPDEVNGHLVAELGIEHDDLAAISAAEGTPALVGPGRNRT